MNGTPTPAQLKLECDRLRSEYGQVALTVVNACTQHRLGQPYDPWSWQAPTAADVDMARDLLSLLRDQA